MSKKNKKPRRVLSGMRPTGRLHLGHLAGALGNWLEFQETYDCFFEIADLHALTTEYQNTAGLAENIFEMAVDFLAAGLDPEKCTIFIQSRVPEISELHLLLSMITPLGWLQRCPTYKEQLSQLAEKEITNYGFLGYPVLQTADIVSVKAEVVPVGEDQLPHLELGREIVRRFNFLYGPTFPEPAEMLTKTPKLAGTDNRKMSKSYGNAVFLADEPGEIERRIAPMYTDPLRPYRRDPGHPEACPVFNIHQVFNLERADSLAGECRAAGIGCRECKQELIDFLVGHLAGFRARRREWAADPGAVERVLEAGSRKAREIVSAVLAEAKGNMGIVAPEKTRKTP